MIAPPTPERAPCLPPGVAGLGRVMQLAFVPRDFQVALDFWTGLGVGPFFALDHVQLNEIRYLGEPVEIDFSMAIGYWGDLQIELIHQHDDAPSVYQAWRDQGLQGLHHVCILVDDMSHARATCAAADAPVLQEAKVPGGGEVIYVDTGGGPGTMVEILKPAQGGPAFFAMMHEAARTWDGRDPLRRL